MLRARISSNEKNISVFSLCSPVCLSCATLDHVHLAHAPRFLCSAVPFRLCVHFPPSLVRTLTHACTLIRARVQRATGLHTFCVEKRESFENLRTKSACPSIRLVERPSRTTMMCSGTALRHTLRARMQHTERHKCDLYGTCARRHSGRRRDAAARRPL